MVIKVINKIIKYIKNPGFILLRLDNLGLIRLSDKKYIELTFKEMMGYKLDLNNPQTYNEKLQWLKLHDRKDIYSTMVDKYEAKKYVADTIGEEYIIKTLGVYNKFDEIDFNDLPNQFVIKCTHDSGGLCICKDKKNFDIEKARKKINKSLRNNYYRMWREWPYKNVKPRIIIEEYLEDHEYHELRDYKFFTFSGKVELMFVASNRQGKGETYFDFFDRKYNHLDIINGHNMNPECPKKTKKYEEMIKLAEKIGKNLNHARIDFYDVDGKIYFGEITFFHWGGFVPFEPKKWDKYLGNMIDISKVRENKNEK